MNSDTTGEILRLYAGGMKKRAIARKLGINIKSVRRTLGKSSAIAGDTAHSHAIMSKESKLMPYLDRIAVKVEQGLTCERILREIREQGYEGGRTILSEYVSKLRGPSHTMRRAFRRFETQPAEEAQCDWSPYRTVIAGREQTVHCFSLVLCHSRYLFIQFHRDERIPSLLSAHVDAFRFFRGVTRRVVYDNMGTVTLGRRGKEILWHPKFLEFARHYLFEPFVCKPYDPNRKGKVERIFFYLERDFLQGRAFSSWEELESSAMHWLSQIANKRTHGTTNQVPEEMWLAERDFLTALPETTFPVYRQEIRKVYDDGMIALDGTRYSVPCEQVSPGSEVTLRVHPQHIEILDYRGILIARHRKPDNPGGVVIEKEHYKAPYRKSSENVCEIDRRFLTFFPNATPFLDGLKRRMKSLYRIHLLEIFKMTRAYGEKAVAEAIAQAGRYGNFNSYAVRRILTSRYPLCEETSLSSIEPLKTQLKPQLDDLDLGAFQDYKDLSHDLDQKISIPKERE